MEIHSKTEDTEEVIEKLQKARDKRQTQRGCL